MLDIQFDWGVDLVHLTPQRMMIQLARVVSRRYRWLSTTVVWYGVGRRAVLDRGKIRGGETFAMVEDRISTSSWMST